MPVEHSIDPDKHLVFSRAFGSIRDTDLLNQRRRLQAHPHFEPGFDQIFELLEHLEAEVSSYGIALLADRRPFGPHSLRAFVVMPDLFDAPEVAQMLQLLEERYPDERRATFPSVELARHWLNSSTHRL